MATAPTAVMTAKKTVPAAERIDARSFLKCAAPTVLSVGAGETFTYRGYKYKLMVVVIGEMERIYDGKIVFAD